MKPSIPDPEALWVENQLMLWLRLYTDRVVWQLQTMPLNEEEALNLIEEARQEILRRFPDKADAYRLIYERRFKRVLQRRGLSLALSPTDETELN
jgi:hypothetical protein